MLCNFNLQIPEFKDTSQNVDIGLTGRRLDYFINLLCQGTLAIPIQTNWAILIDFQECPNLLPMIKEIAKEFEPSQNYIDNSILEVSQNKYQNIIGCVFAQAVRMPGDSIQIERAGGGQGYASAPITAMRSFPQTLEIGFLETNISFTDFFIKPWLALVGYKGLVARSKQSSIKASFTVIQLAKTERGNKVRKVTKFTGVAPIYVMDEDLKYDTGSNQNIERQCTFTFSESAISEHL